MSQATLFQQHHPGTAPKPSADSAEEAHSASGADAKRLSYARPQETLGTRQRQYMELMRRVAKEGQRTNGGERVYALTDAEAAAILDIGRSSVNARRAELSGGYGAIDGTKEQPLIVKHETRKCKVTGKTATAWKAAPTLFE